MSSTIVVVSKENMENNQSNKTVINWMEYSGVNSEYQTDIAEMLIKLLFHRSWAKPY